MLKKIDLKYVIVYIIVLLIVTALPSAWKIHQQHKQIVDLRAKNIAHWDLWKNGQTKIVMLAKENKELNNLYIAQIQSTIKWKKLAENLSIKEIKPNEEYSMDTLTDCYYAEAIMNIKDRTGTLNIIPQPVLLHIELAYIDKGLSVGRAWTDPGCIIFEDTKLDIPDNLNLDCYKENKWPWVIGALGAGIIVGCFIE